MGLTKWQVKLAEKVGLFTRAWYPAGAQGDEELKFVLRPLAEGDVIANSQYWAELVDDASLKAEARKSFENAETLKRGNAEAPPFIPPEDLGGDLPPPTAMMLQARENEIFLDRRRKHKYWLLRRMVTPPEWLGEVWGWNEENAETLKRGNAGEDSGGVREPRSADADPMGELYVDIVEPLYAHCRRVLLDSTRLLPESAPAEAERAAGK